MAAIAMEAVQLYSQQLQAGQQGDVGFERKAYPWRAAADQDTIAPVCVKELHAELASQEKAEDSYNQAAPLC
eukprot:CAMPEP_0195099604 /NCGR_PEP_ID=MMETSP0448-20130528/58510_1 /TAXON_ID=66468 /ORGANISM="Heterocapsa triquestra, Strain CCMP 448" /LENGTH=71 /DNA_ID=CAMNT_0040134519 /DNA_START=61 /DNA_END=273 /DNA_ORIENTATION=+